MDEDGEQLDGRALRTVALVTGGLGAGALAMVLAARSIKPPPVPLPPAVEAPIVRYSPAGGVAELVAWEIDRARQSIRLQGYGFTSEPIAEALVRAHRRGVDVRICLDRSNRTDKHSQADRCHRAGITVLLDARHAIAHSKVLVVDGRTVGTGSYNWTDAAERSNLENHVVLPSPELASAYLKNWEEHAAHSEPYGLDDGRVAR
jgi:phosphatidylserine/phosphatidylglycerophosphate/cardiolipin synthase-like enzyme